ncbi:translocation/assembly module TamB domain-containing protein [Shewanella sp. AS1]|uniref:autotransporter assembly complex protein TamB n=1 Tax=Shewanella sp. AS1 TaxID=2907626 RepID=UPI001F313941|nr:translocation/assembly module TamB domain-containing protein [Shewanella sp. AS1]MCE9678591.1 translocation/assembly module TamB domain-containing protein [Shewanella sp. AS1]
MSSAPESNNTARPEPVKTSSVARLLIWIKHTLRLLVYLPLLLLVVAAILIGTPFGSRIAVNLADAFVPNLDLTYESGTLNSKLSLSYAHWQMTGIEVEVKQLQLDWRPLCFVQQQLCVNALHTGSADVNIDTQLIPLSPETQPEDPDASSSQTLTDEPFELQLPFGINLTQGQLSNVYVRVDEMHFSAKQLSTQASWLSTGLRVNYLDSDGLIVQIPLSAETEAKAAPAPAAQEQQAWPLAQMPQVPIPMPIFVEKAQLTDSQLQIGPRQDHFASILLQGSYVGYHIQVDKLDLQHDEADMQLQGNISLEDQYPMNLKLAVQTDHIKTLPQLDKQRVSAQLSGDLSALHLDARGNGHIQFQLNANIDLTQASLPYSVTLGSDHIMWPLKEAIYEAKALYLSSQGNLEQQTAILTSQILTPYHPPLQLETQLSHHKQQLNIEHLDLTSAMGNAQLSGLLAYGDTISWDLSIDTQDLQLEQINIDDETSLPRTAIAGHIKTWGRIEDKHWQIAINETKLSGHIDDYPLELEGDLQVNEQYHLNAKQLILKALGSEFALSGQVEQSWALDGKLSIPDLSLWHKDADGSVAMDIKATGDNAHPVISIDGNVSGLQFTDISLAQAQLNGNYRPQDEHQFALFLEASDLQQKDLLISTVNLTFAGDQNQQSLALQSQGDINLTTALDSQFDIDTEQLELDVNQLTLASAIGAIELDNPVHIQWNNKQQTGSVPPFCWRHSDGALCLTDTAELAKTGDASIDFNGDIGAIIAPLLPSEVKWYGPTSLDGKFSWSEKQKPRAQINVKLAPGNLEFQSAKQQAQTHYQNVEISLNLDDKQLRLITLFESEKLANVNSHIEIGVTPDNPLSGEIIFNRINLHALTGFAPQLEVLEGMVSSKLTLSGTLKKPMIVGNIQLKDGQLLAANNPTRLDNIQFNMDLNGRYAQFDGGWNMGDGKASLKGDLDWRGEKLLGNIDFSGDKLAVTQPPMVLLDLSPELKIQFSRDNIDIRGQLDVPSGHIKIVQLPEGGIAESSDVVFQDSLSEQQEKKRPIAISSRVKIHVGDRLAIDGMGLKGMLVGTLDLRQEPFNPPRLYGDVRVVKGSYRFMGQTLAIKRGEVQFIGPMEVPNLNIEAVREIKSEDVIAGVRITGTPLKPIVTLFSNPAKEQAEIISYIVKGTGFNNNSGDQNSAFMMSAALTLSNQIGDGSVNNLGNSATGVIEKLGLSNVQFDTNDEGKVAISGYLGENLMVKYGVGVFSPGYEMTVRYYLLTQLYLESVSSAVEKSLDIYYNFDID